MEQNYSVLSGRYDYNNRLNRLNKEDLLAIGIMDTGTREDLELTIKWYSENFNHNLHVITNEERMSSSPLQATYPKVTFIVFQKLPSLAERINALSNECMTSYFYLTRSDIETVAFDWEFLYGKFRGEDHIAVLTPLVFNKDKELSPKVFAPHFEKKEIEPFSYIPSRNDDFNLYPFLGLGLYDRALFQRIRGYDTEIKSAYWQVLDFGTRCWLYGYRIYSVNYMAVFFPTKQYLIEDRTEDDGTERFYTKALGVQLSRSKEVLLHKGYRCDRHVLNDEVRPRLAMYRTDFQTLCAFWKIPAEDK